MSSKGSREAIVVATLLSIIPIGILLILTMNVFHSVYENNNFSMLYLRWGLQYLGIWLGIVGAIIFAYNSIKNSKPCWSFVSLFLVVIGFVSIVFFEIEWWSDPKRLLPIGVAEIPVISYIGAGYAMKFINKKADM